MKFPIQALLALFLICHARAPASAVEEAPLPGPVLKSEITALVPQSLSNTNMEDPRVTCIIQINHLGKVEDLVAIEATHIGLVRRAESLILEAEFDPGDVNEGESVRLEFILGFNYPSQMGINSKTTMDDVEIMIDSVKDEDHRLELVLPGELDAMPQILDRGQVYVATNPAGERISGSAKVEFYVNHLGEVRLPRILESSDPEISKAAILSVRDMKFTPPMAGEKPAVTKFRMPFNSGSGK